MDGLHAASAANSTFSRRTTYEDSMWGGSPEAVSKLEMGGENAGRHELGFWPERRRLAGKPLILQQMLPCSFCKAAETAALPGPENAGFLSFETASGEPPHMRKSGTCDSSVTGH